LGETEVPVVTHLLSNLLIDLGELSCAHLGLLLAALALSFAFTLAFALAFTLAFALAFTTLSFATTLARVTGAA
jgi:hypothetical protein